MKKFYYLSMAALALMATACSSDETVEMSPSSKQAIGFNAFVDKSVRADITTDNIKEFAVYGFAGDSNTKIFDGEKVSKVGTDWEYSPLRYWNTSLNYWFTAIAPCGGNYSLTFPNPDTETGNGHPAYSGGGTITFENDKAEGKQDLIYAFSGEQKGSEHPSTDNNAKVAFTFNHLLSKVRFTFLNNVATGYTLQVTDLKITVGAKASASIEPTQTTTDGNTTLGGDWANYGNDFDLAYDGQNVAYREGDGTPDNQQYYEEVTTESGTTYKEIEDVRYLIPFSTSTTTDGVTTTTTTLIATFKLYASHASSTGASWTLDYPSPTDNSGTQTKSDAKSFTATITINEGLKKGYSYNIIAAITAPVLEDNLTPILFTVDKVNEYTEENITMEKGGTGTATYTETTTDGGNS